MIGGNFVNCKFSQVKNTYCRFVSGIFTYSEYSADQNVKEPFVETIAQMPVLMNVRKNILNEFMSTIVLEWSMFETSFGIKVTNKKIQ